jgi:hypothetical protein
VCCRRRSAAGACWRDVRPRGGLVQRGTRKGAAVVFHLLLAMSGEREGNGAEEYGRGWLGLLEHAILLPRAAGPE